MITKKMGSMLVVRLDKGEELVSSLLQIMDVQKIATASVTGLGAVDEACICVLDPVVGDYVGRVLTGPMEIASLVGNLSRRDGQPFAHLHITLANGSFQLTGGHLRSARISVTGEIMVQCLEGSVTRAFNPDIHIYEMQL